MDASVDMTLIGGRLLWPLPCNDCNRFRLSCNLLPSDNSLTCSGAAVVVVVVVVVDDDDDDVLVRVGVSASDLVRIKSR